MISQHLMCLFESFKSHNQLSHTRMNKSIIQQLRSILDDLEKQFNEHDRIMTEYVPANRYHRRSKRIRSKLINQISALKETIKFYETASQ